MIRLDASTSIGAGHFTRCLTLADALRTHGGNITFVCIALPKTLESMARSRGHDVIQIGDCDPGSEEDANRTKTAIGHMGHCKRPEIDWLIIDHYSIEAAWEASLRTVVDRILVIDDLANRRHDCDVLLDQNYYDDAPHRYGTLVPRHCTMALGPAFALLREEFLAGRPARHKRDGEIRRVLVSFGGADPGNETGKALETLGVGDLSAIHVDVAIGSLNTIAEELKRRHGGRENVHLIENVASMAELMDEADLAVGAGGSTTWERCAMQLPSVVIATAENQVESCEALHRAGAIRYLGWHEVVTADAIYDSVVWLKSNPVAAAALGRKSLEIMGEGGPLGADLGILRILMAPRAAGARS